MPDRRGTLTGPSILVNIGRSSNSGGDIFNQADLPGHPTSAYSRAVARNARIAQLRCTRWCRPGAAPADTPACAPLRSGTCTLGVTHSADPYQTKWQLYTTPTLYQAKSKTIG